MCDTFVAMPAQTTDGSVIFGKNSDREPNEAQSIEYHPGETFKKTESVQCTYIQIPRAKERFATLISRPFWMWGAEMGANEKGVVIGNEAVFTKMPTQKQNVLTGMDMLRLALEQSTSSKEALATIVKLLSDYDQGGICGYEDKKLTYHNSFIIADPKEAWVLETAGKLWAAVKVKEYYAISNGLSIGEEFDESHPELIPYARKKGWLKKNHTFNFANCYSDWFFTTFSGSRTRKGRADKLLQNNTKKIDVFSAINHLRDHKDIDYHPAKHLLMNSICSHSANKLSRHAAQTTGSIIAHLTDSANNYWATGTSAPCTSIFKPVSFNGSVLPNTGSIPNETFSPDTLWWQHELLHRSVLLNYKKHIKLYADDRNALEKKFYTDFINAKAEEKWNISNNCFDIAKQKIMLWYNQIMEHGYKPTPNLLYQHYWRAQNQQADMPT